jgi:hypothetical protein
MTRTGVVSIVVTAVFALAIGWYCGSAATHRQDGRVLLDATYLDEANAIDFNLRLIELARAAGDTRVIENLERRNGLAVIALERIGVDSTRANRDQIVGVLDRLSKYQAATHGAVDQNLTALLNRLKA